MQIVTTICKFSPRSHNSGTSVNFAWMILHLLGFIAPFPPVSLLHQCGRGFRKAQPSEAHLLCEKQPEQRGGGPRANGEAVPPHRPQVLKWERFRLTKATSEDTVNGDRVCASRLPPVSETVWRGLLQDLLDMQQNVYTCLKPQVCHQVNWTHRWLWDSFSGHFAALQVGESFGLMEFFFAALLQVNTGSNHQFGIQFLYKCTCEVLNCKRNRPHLGTRGPFNSAHKAKHFSSKSYLVC